MSFFEPLKKGLFKSRKSLSDSLGELFGNHNEIDEDFYEELEETLILADLGTDTVFDLITSLKEDVKEEKCRKISEAKEMLLQEMVFMLTDDNEQELIQKDRMNVIMVIGVNGAGKTTSIGKMAYRFREQGLKVVLAAADTFRAAAIDQLGVWAERAEVEMVSKEESSDPGAVVYEAAQVARSRKADVLLVDTAGRLHNKKNLMEELAKLGRIIDKEFPDANRQVLLVLDGATGQNALSQAKLFSEAAPVNGIVLTKLDGSSKGGVVLGIKHELGIPVRFVGVGEGIGDLLPFNAEEFGRALLEE